MTSIKKLRIAYIALAVLGLVGLVVSILRQGDGWRKDSDMREMVYADALKTIDSIFVANEKEPEKYAEFKDAASTLTPQNLEFECFRMLASKEMAWKEEYYARALVERYSPDMPLDDKARVVKILNNLGCIYSDNNKPEDAFRLLKTGYEMCKDFDVSKKTQPAFLCNMAGIFKNYGDDQTANKLYLDAVEIAYSPEYRPGDIRVSESAKIQTLIEYLQYAWVTDKLVTNRADYEKYIKEMPKSTYEHYPYARYLCEAVNSYVKGYYQESSILLDSAFNSTRFSFAEDQYHGLGKLFQADAMFHAKDYPQMRQRLDEAEKIIKDNDLIYLYSDLYKGKTAYYRHIGDSVSAAVSRSEGLAINDSLFSNRNYAALRDVQSQWDRTWAEIEVQQARKTTIWLVISSICLIIGTVCFAITFRPKVSRPSGSGEIAASEASPAVSDIADEVADEEEIPAMPDDGSEVADEESEDSLRELYAEICEALPKSPNVFKVEFSISMFANEMGINSRRISQAVNACSGKNFSSFLAEFRVRKACEILDNVKNPWERPTMDALAQMVGYKSRAHLSRVFKTVIGMSPTEYTSKSPQS